MRSNKKSYNVFQLSSAIFMMVALAWLTISAPFVYAFEQDLAKQNKITHSSTPPGGNEEEAPNSLTNTTEEKNSKSSNTSVTEEYLHHNHTSEYFFSISSPYYNAENADDYIAFHGEVQVPPPNVA